MVSQIYPSEFQWDNANSFDTKAHFLDLGLPITIDIVLSKIYNKQNDFDFKIFKHLAPINRLRF